MKMTLLALVAAVTMGVHAMTVLELEKALEKSPQGDDAAALAEDVRKFFGKDALKDMIQLKSDGLIAAWAYEDSQLKSAPEITNEDGSFKLQLKQLGSSGVWVAAKTLPDDTVMRWSANIEKKRLGGGPLEIYAIHPDSVERPDVPKGKLELHEDWKSKVFDGTTRNWWVYVPAQYTADKPACVMVFQDGGGYAKYVPTIFDNLIHRKDMPVTIGIFINPGVFDDKKSNRSFEYDTLSDQYARFLLDEILPEVEKAVKLRHDAASRAISGISSGGICAFTAAWERPNEFGKVLSWVGSFTNIASGKSMREGGHNYAALIRRVKPAKPIRVFLQEGENDLNNEYGNWPLANREMASSLAFAGYDYKFVMGKGFHSDRHGKAILPDSLRWLWREYAP